MKKENFSIKNLLELSGYKKNKLGIYTSGNEGYWSNLDKDMNLKFRELLKEMKPIDAVRNLIPELEDHIYSEKREVGLELLDIKKGDICIDYGCMWGVLSVGMAKRGGKVIAVDQTIDSLEFLNSRKNHEAYKNIFCVQDDVRKISLENSADIAVVNGVLEWIPEFGEVELKKFFGKKEGRDYPKISPKETQISFLKKVHQNLKDNGKIFLAIENRYDYKQFLGWKDPHANLYFTSFLPRFLSNLISKIKLGRPYVNYLYSFNSLKKLLIKSGFSEVDLYTAYPHYHSPLFILPYNSSLKSRRRFWHSKNASWRLKALLTFNFFSPSIIAVGKK